MISLHLFTYQASHSAPAATTPSANKRSIILSSSCDLFELRGLFLSLESKLLLEQVDYKICHGISERVQWASYLYEYLRSPSSSPLFQPYFFTRVLSSHGITASSANGFVYVGRLVFTKTITRPRTTLRDLLT